MNDVEQPRCTCHYLTPAACPFHGKRDEMTSESLVGPSLYGRQDGMFAVLLSPVGFIPPSTIGGLLYLGEPVGVIIGLHRTLTRRFGRSRVPVQQAIADLLGVSQQSVSRYLEESSNHVPELSDDGWRGLIRAHFDPSELVDRAAVGGAGGGGRPEDHMNTHDRDRRT